MKNLVISIFLILVLSGCSFTVHEEVTVDELNISLHGQVSGAWIWESDEIKKASLVPQMKEFGLERVFVNIGVENSVHMLNAEPKKFRNFIKKAKDEQIQVEGLYGEHTWAYEENLPAILDEVEILLDFNKKYPNTRFDALHLDIEPHTLPGWKKNQNFGNEEILEPFIHNLEKVSELVNQHNEEEDDELKIVLDTHRSVAMNEFQGAPFIKSLEGLVDEVYLMNYVRNVEDFIEYGKAILELSSLPITMGVEFQTESSSGDPKEDADIKAVTLAVLSHQELEQYLNKAVSSFNKFTNYNGLALHQFQSFLEYNRGGN